MNEIKNFLDKRFYNWFDQQTPFTIANYLNNSLVYYNINPRDYGNGANNINPRDYGNGANNINPRDYGMGNLSSSNKVGILNKDQASNEISLSDDELEQLVCQKPDLQTLNKFNNNIGALDKAVEGIHGEIRHESGVSALIGQEGEKYVRNLLNQLNIWQLDEIKTSKCSGDIKGKPNTRDHIHKNYSLIVEVKNYTKSIPFAEVEKFYRDIEHNADYNMGIFVSLNQPIARIPKNIYYENKIIGGIYRHLVFINLNTDKNENLDILKTISELLIMQSCCYNKLDSNHAFHVTEIVNNLNKFTDLRVQIRELRKVLNDSTTNMEHLVIELEHNIKKHIDILRKDIDINDKVDFDAKAICEMVELLNTTQKNKMDLIEFLNMINESENLFKFILNKKLNIKFTLVNSKINIISLEEDEKKIAEITILKTKVTIKFYYDKKENIKSVLDHTLEVNMAQQFIIFDLSSFRNIL
jgi:hypothetical protein